MLERSELPHQAITVDRQGQLYFLVKGVGVVNCTVSIETNGNGESDAVVRCPMASVGVVLWATLEEISTQENIGFLTTAEAIRE